jgi:hypothetical protein
MDVDQRCLVYAGLENRFKLDGEPSLIAQARADEKRGRIGRPLKFNEPSVTVRVPVSKVAAVEALIRKAKRKLPMIVVGKPNEAPMSADA